MTELYFPMTPTFWEISWEEGSCTGLTLREQWLHQGIPTGLWQQLHWTAWISDIPHAWESFVMLKAK